MCSVWSIQRLLAWACAICSYCAGVPVGWRRLATGRATSSASDGGSENSRKRQGGRTACCWMAAMAKQCPPRCMAPVACPSGSCLLVFGCGIQPPCEKSRDHGLAEQVLRRRAVVVPSGEGCEGGWRVSGGGLVEGIGGEAARNGPSEPPVTGTAAPTRLHSLCSCHATDMHRHALTCTDTPTQIICKRACCDRHDSPRPARRAGPNRRPRPRPPPPPTRLSVCASLHTARCVAQLHGCISLDLIPLTGVAVRVPWVAQISAWCLDA